MAITLRNNIFLKIEKPEQKDALSLALVSLIVIILLGVFVLRPAISSAIEQISNNKLKTELIKRQEEKIGTLESLNLDLVEYDREVQLLRSSLDDDFVTEFFAINFHNYFASLQAARLMSIEFEEGLIPGRFVVIEGLEGYVPIIGTIEFEADYPSFVEVVSYVEKFPRILNIKSIEVSPQNSDLPLNIKIEVEYLIKPKVDE